MTPNLDTTRPHPPFPSPADAILAMLLPFMGAGIAAFIVGIPALTAVVSLAVSVIAMIAAGTFLVSLTILPDKSFFRARLGMLYDHPSPSWLQRWYVPFAAAAVAGALAESFRTVLSMRNAGARVSSQVLLAAAGIGVLEGVFLVLVLALSWALTSVRLESRWRRGLTSA